MNSEMDDVAEFRHGEISRKQKVLSRFLSIIPTSKVLTPLYVFSEVFRRFTWIRNKWILRQNVVNGPGSAEGVCCWMFGPSMLFSRQLSHSTGFIAI